MISKNDAVSLRQELSEVSAADHAAPSRTFAEVGETVVAGKLQDQTWDSKSAGQARALYAVFSKFLSEEHNITAFGELRQAHLDAYGKFMRTLHSDYGRSPADTTRSIAELREVARGRPSEKQGLALPTQNRHLAQLGTLLGEAERLGEMLDRDLNLSRLRVKKPGRAPDDRKPSMGEVDAFFRSPIFMGCLSWQKPHEPGEQVFHRGAYFGPLLAYYQGMRLSDLCSLAISEVVSGFSPHPYLTSAPANSVVCRTPSPPGTWCCIQNSSGSGLSNMSKCSKGEDMIACSLTSMLQVFHIAPATGCPGELEPLRKTSDVAQHQFRRLFDEELEKERVTAELRADLLGRSADAEPDTRNCDPEKLERQLEALSKLPVCTAHIERKPIQLLPWVTQRRMAPWSRTDHDLKNE